MNSKPSTSFAEIVEEIPLESYEDTTDGPKNGALRRSSTDAHTSNYHPPLRVRFNSLSTGRARQFSEDGVELLTAKAHEIGHAHWQGGWQNTVLKKRCKGWSPRSEEEEVKEIAQAMEEDSRLMTDDVDGEVQRRDALRELTKSLKFKKEVKERLTLKQRSVRRASTKRISFYMSFKYSFRMKWFRFKESLKSAWRDYSLWHRAIKDVEGMYGTSVGSYFHFLKSLFLLNMVVAFITVGYVLIPQLLENKRLKSEKSNDEIPPSELTTPSDIFYYEYITTIKPFLLSSQNVTISTSSNNATFGLMDCITGAGWFSDTALYYGGYSTGIILASPATNGTSSTSYDMTCAYFVTITTCFIIYFIALLCRILKMYRENFIDTEADVNVTFVEKVFSAWDFTITEEKSAAIKKRNIFNELIELLQEYLDDEEVEGFMQRFSRRCLQAFAWFILVSFMILLSWGLYVLLNENLHVPPEDGEAYWTHSFEMLLYPIIVTLLMGVIPILLESISSMEKYSKPRYQLYVNLIRVFILEIVILVALVLFWYQRSPGLEEELTSLHQTFSTSSQSQQKQDKGHHKSNVTSVDCWESELGEEIYRLVVIDFIYIALSTLVVDSLKPYIVASGKASDSILEFSIPRNSIHVIYNQTLLWAGIFFCPLLPLIISIKFFILFYLQKFTVMRNLRPIDRPWRAGQTQTLFYALTLMSLILSFASYVFIIVRGYSSSSCGPFQEYTHYMDVILEISGTSEQMFLQMFAFILKPGFILFIIFILILCVYCIKNLSEGRAQLVDVLKSQLELEMKDRVFLQRLIERVQRGEYLPRYAASPSRSVPTTPNFTDESIADPKHLTKRSSFVFERRTSGADSLFNGTQL